MFIWVQLEYTLDGHCLGRKTFPIGREPPSSMCFASWFPPCRWDVFWLGRNIFPIGKEGTANREATRIVVGNSLSMGETGQQAAIKDPASSQQTSKRKQPASSQPCCSQQASKKQAANKQQVSSKQSAASCLPQCVLIPYSIPAYRGSFSS